MHTFKLKVVLETMPPCPILEGVIYKLLIQKASLYSTAYRTDTSHFQNGQHKKQKQAF